MINNITLVGRLGADAETGYTQNDKAFARFRLGVQRNKDTADWFSVILYGDQAERIGRWLTKGRLVGVVGRIETYKREGAEATYYSVVAGRLEFLDSKRSEDTPVAVGTGAKAKASDDEEDVPF